MPKEATLAKVESRQLRLALKPRVERPDARLRQTRAALKLSVVNRQLAEATEAVKVVNPISGEQRALVGP